MMRRARETRDRFLESGPSSRELGAAALAVALAALAAIGWGAGPVLLAAVIALQLAAAGFGSVALLGPAIGGAIGRYLVLPAAAVTVSLFGRLLPGIPIAVLAIGAAALLWAVARVELSQAKRRGSRTALDLVLVGIVFGGASGVLTVVGTDGWPPALFLIGLVAVCAGLRAAEARGAEGGDAMGQAALHALAVVQVLAALIILGLPGAVVPALGALAFYTWSGAADALQARASWRGVAIEFGSLALIGLVVAFLVRSG